MIWVVHISGLIDGGIAHNKSQKGTIMFDYFYGNQSEQFAFICVPRIFFTDKKFVELSSDAKILYGILLSRMELSAKNGWMDEDGKVYIIYTVEKSQECLGRGNKNAIALMNDLEKRSD